MSMHVCKAVRVHTWHVHELYLLNCNKQLCGSIVDLHSVSAGMS